MKMVDIKVIAKNMAIKPGKMKKAELIRTIQAQEGNFQCFQTGLADSDCDQVQCCWRSDCMA